MVVGVSGGIATYKVCELVRALKTRGAAVVTVMTPAATQFVGPLTFEALSGNPVLTDLWGHQRLAWDLPETARRRMGGKVAHVDVAEAADCLVIAPATADLMARLVRGETGDALTAVALATPAPQVLCPSMDAQMWRHDATRANLATLRARGVRVVEPETGELASGLAGPGRLPAIETILEEVAAALERRASLHDVDVLVTAGSTEEPLDPVRVLTNRSSGKMGYALAAAARDRGAKVTLVSGPARVEPPHGVALVRVSSAAQMESAVRAHATRARVVLMAAAVADYRPARVATGKLRSGEQELTVGLVPNPDILAGIGRARRRGQIIVGFALETAPGLTAARRKLLQKGCDLIVLNNVRERGAELGGDTNKVTLVAARGVDRLPVLSKREVAERILDRVAAMLTARRSTAERPARPRPRRAARISRS